MEKAKSSRVLPYCYQLFKAWIPIALWFVSSITFAAQTVADFTTLNGGNPGNLGSPTQTVNGITANAWWRTDAGPWNGPGSSSPANLYLRNNSNDHGLGVCNPQEAGGAYPAHDCPGPNSGGDVNELDNMGQNEAIVLALPIGKQWVSVTISSLDNEFTASESGLLYADADGIPNTTTPGNIGDSVIRAFSSPSEPIEFTINIPDEFKDSHYLVFEPFKASGDNRNNDYLVWKAAVTDVPQQAQLGDFVWEDQNGDGIQQATEPGIPNLIVKLHPFANNVCDTNQTLAQTTTNANGLYLFDNLTAGDYCVAFTKPTNDFCGGNVPKFTERMAQGSTPEDDSNANTTTGLSDKIELGFNESDLTIDAGVYCPASLGDTLWNDLNADGIQDNLNGFVGEPGVDGQTVKLLKCDGTVVASTTTGTQPLPAEFQQGSGRYAFTGLRPGCYVVEFTAPSGALFSPKEAGTDTALDSNPNPNTGKTDPINLSSGEVDPTIDAGVFQPTPEAKLGDYVWEDLNANGKQDLNEPGVFDVPVTLYDCANNQIGSTSTDSNGGYLFEGLAAGCYQVKFDKQLPDCDDPHFTLLKAQGVAADANSDADLGTGFSDEVNLADNEINRTIDAGLYCPAALGDTVWSDLNRNGRQDSLNQQGGEPGQAGFRVLLADCNGNEVYDVDGVLVQPVTTDPLGQYRFDNLVPGQYKVTFDPNSLFGLVFTFQNAPSTTMENDSNPDRSSGMTGCITLKSREFNPTIDAGVFEPAEPQINVEKATNGDDADQPTGPVIPVGGTATFTYVVTNTGNVALNNIVLMDDNGTSGSSGDDYVVNCPSNSLLPGESINCTSGQLTVTEGQYVNVAKVCGIYTNVVGQETTVCDDDPSHHFGSLGCSLSVDKTCVVPLPPVSGNVCDTLGKPTSLTFLYTGFGTAVMTGQDSGKSTATGDPNGASPVFVRVTDKSSPTDTSGKIFFSGQVTKDQTFVASVANANTDKFAANTFVYVFNSINQTQLLQTVLYHTSCSQPIQLGDVIGSMELVKYVGQNGAADLPQSQEPSDSCVAELPIGPSCDTVGKPTSLTFKYIPGDCSNGNNPQGGKATCTGGVDPTKSVSVTSGNSGYSIAPMTVAPGGEFTVSSSSFDANSSFTLSNSGGTEVLNIHTSCSQVLAAGNRFGNLELVGFNGQRADIEVDYQYEIKNTGTTLVTVNSVFDSALKELLNSSETLEPDETLLLEKTAFIEATTQNSVTVQGAPVDSSASCEATDSLTVTVVEPEEPCNVCKGGTTDLTFQNLGPAGYIRVYDDGSVKPDKLLFEGQVANGGTFSVTKRNGQNSLNNDISITVDDVYNTKVHTSCSQPIGPNAVFGGFMVIEGRSKDNGLMCPLVACAPVAVSHEFHDREFRWNVSNNGDFGLEIKKITIEWPAANGFLDELKRDGDTFHKGNFAAPSAVIASGWEGDANKRTIKPGETDTLKFKFQNNAVPGTYHIRVEFATGCDIELNL